MKKHKLVETITPVNGNRGTITTVVEFDEKDPDTRCCINSWSDIVTITASVKTNVGDEAALHVHEAAKVATESFLQRKHDPIGELSKMLAMNGFSE